MEKRHEDDFQHISLKRTLKLKVEFSQSHKLARSNTAERMAISGRLARSLKTICQCGPRSAPVEEEMIIAAQCHMHSTTKRDVCVCTLPPIMQSIEITKLKLEPITQLLLLKANVRPLSRKCARVLCRLWAGSRVCPNSNRNDSIHNKH